MLRQKQNAKDFFFLVSGQALYHHININNIKRTIKSEVIYMINIYFFLQYVILDLYDKEQ